jgi:hypothetical protein
MFQQGTKQGYFTIPDVNVDWGNPSVCFGGILSSPNNNIPSRLVLGTYFEVASLLKVEEIVNDSVKRAAVL